MAKCKFLYMARDLCPGITTAIVFSTHVSWYCLTISQTQKHSNASTGFLFFVHLLNMFILYTYVHWSAHSWAASCKCKCTGNLAFTSDTTKQVYMARDLCPGSNTSMTFSIHVCCYCYLLHTCVLLLFDNIGNPKSFHRTNPFAFLNYGFRITQTW